VAKSPLEKHTKANNFIGSWVDSTLNYVSRLLKSMAEIVPAIFF
jgi:hypothetical protein